MSDKKDTLWWAVKRNDQELAKRLLQRARTNGEKYNLNTACELAIHTNNAEMLWIIADSHNLFYAQIKNHRDWIKKHQSFHFFEPIFAQWDYSGMNDNDQHSYLHLILSLSSHTLAEQWIPQINSSASIDHIGQEILGTLKREDLFVIWYDRCVKPLDNEDVDVALCSAALHRDCAKAWKNFDNGTNLMLQHKLWSDLSGPDILSLVWDNLPEHAINDILIKQAQQGPRENNILQWAVDNNKLNEPQKILVLEVGLIQPHLPTLEIMFSQVAASDKQKMARTIQDQNKTIDFFKELCEFEHNDPTPSQHDIQWNIITFSGLINKWIEKCHIQRIMPWIDRCTPEQQQQTIVAAARAGQLNEVIALLNLGIENPLGTLMAQAAAEGHDHVVEFFLQQSPTSDQIKEACFCATKDKHIKVLTLLYPHLDPAHRQLIFDNAVSYEHDEGVKFLMTQGMTLDLTDPHWKRWIKYVIDEFNDTTVPLISSLIPHDNVNAQLFGWAVHQGTLETAKTLLSHFDHSTFSFQQALINLISNKSSDLNMFKLLLDHLDGYHLEELMLGEVLDGGNHIIFEELIDRGTHPDTTSDALWWAICYRKKHMVQKLLNKANVHMFNNCMLLQAGRQNNSDIIDLLLPMYSFEDIEMALQRLYVEPEIMKQWSNLYLVTRYNQLRERREIELAVHGEGTEGRGRRM